MDKLISLINMNPGDSGLVKQIYGGHGLLSRLESLGIRRGVKIKKVSSFFKTGPTIIQVGMSQVAIGKGMSEKILVEVINDESTVNRKS